MRKIGTTTTGNIIVEVTKDEYNLLLQGSPKPVAAQVGARSMSHADLATYVSDRLKKLAPKKRDGVVRSIEAMFQFSSGLSSADLEKLLVTLQKRKFFAISPEGKVTYLGT